MQYRIAFADDASPGIPIGVGGDVRDDLPSYVTFFVCVADLEKSVHDVVRLGGKVMRSPAQAPDGGVRVALIEDPQEHVVGLVDEKSLPSDTAENDLRSIVNDRIRATRAKDAASASQHFSDDAVVFDIVNSLQFAGRVAHRESSRRSGVVAPRSKSHRLQPCAPSRARSHHRRRDDRHVVARDEQLRKIRRRLENNARAQFRPIRSKLRARVAQPASVICLTPRRPSCTFRLQRER